VCRVDDALVWLVATKVTSDNRRAVEYDDLFVTHENLDRPANKATRNAVSNGVDVDETVRRYASRESSLAHWDRSGGQRA
jgi:hypothetical protein